MRKLLSLVLLTAALVGCQKVHTLPEPPVKRSMAVVITFPAPPSPEAVQALRLAGALETPEPRYWVLPSYDFRNADQGRAIEAAIRERAKFGPETP